MAKNEILTPAGDRRCDFCGCRLADNGWYVDGRTVHGPWAYMCPEDYVYRGVGLGKGNGQKYDSESGLKLEG